MSSEARNDNSQNLSMFLFLLVRGIVSKGAHQGEVGAGQELGKGWGGCVVGGREGEGGMLNNARGKGRERNGGETVSLG